MDVDVNKELPKGLTYSLADFHLYRIGLCLTKDKKLLKKRKAFNNPLIVFIVFLIFLSLKTCALSYNDDTDRKVFVILGDFGHFMGIRVDYDIMFILITLLAIFSQIIYWYNFRIGVEPTFLRLFQMMSGSISPKSIGLVDGYQILKLIRQMKLMCRITRPNAQYLIPFTGLFTAVIIFFTYADITTAILFGVPNAIFFALYAVHFWNVVLYQIIYFYFICKYLKLKINELHEKIEIVGRKRCLFGRIPEILQRFDSIYCEINEYNQTFWSKFLLIFWLTFGSATVLMIYVTAFHSMALPIKLIFFYVLVILIIIFLFVILTTSSLNAKANSSYKSLNRLIISFSVLHRRQTYFRINTKIKVLVLSCWKILTLPFY